MMVPSGLRLINFPSTAGVSRTAKPVVPAPTTVARIIEVPGVVVGADCVLGFAAFFVVARTLAFVTTRRRVVFGARRGVGALLGTVADGGTVGAVSGGAVFVDCAEAVGLNEPAPTKDVATARDPSEVRNTTERDGV
jgi:hypothetical protein